MAIGKILSELLIKKNISKSELARRVGVTPSTISSIIERDNAGIKITLLNDICKELRVSPEIFFEDFASSKLYSAENTLPLPKTKKVPLVGTIACGEPITAVENVECYVDMTEDIHADFCLRCKGDSMINARIFDGDIVYIRQQPDVENGEIAAVLIDGEATLKRVFKHFNGVELRAENPTFKSLYYSGYEAENIKILGKAVAFLSEVV